MKYYFAIQNKNQNKQNVSNESHKEMAKSLEFDVILFFGGKPCTVFSFLLTFG